MRVLRRVAVLMAVGAALFGAPAVASADAAVNGTQRAAAENVVVLDSFRCVVADSMRVFSSATNNTVIGILPRGEIVHVIGHSGIRYRIDYPINGWISDDPRWTDPC